MKKIEQQRFRPRQSLQIVHFTTTFGGKQGPNIPGEDTLLQF